MKHTTKLLRLQREMKESFAQIKHNPMDLNRIMAHVAKLSEAVHTLIEEQVGTVDIFELHMEMLGTPPQGYPKPQVHHVDHWRNLGRTIKAGEGADLSLVDPASLMVWSDQHFHHKKIIEFSNRPFNDLSHMHVEMAKRFKLATVPGQIVLWCGDVGFCGSTALAEIMEDYKHTYNILIVGNHDIERDGKLRKLDMFDEIHTSLVFDNYVVTHHPWTNMLPDGMVNIHGHLHDRPFSMKNHLCACVELTDYRPVSLAHLIHKGQLDDIKREKEQHAEV